MIKTTSTGCLNQVAQIVEKHDGRNNLLKNLPSEIVITFFTWRKINSYSFIVFYLKNVLRFNGKDFLGV